MVILIYDWLEQASLVPTISAGLAVYFYPRQTSRRSQRPLMSPLSALHLFLEAHALFYMTHR